jgi:hypothetical protein
MNTQPTPPELYLHHAGQDLGPYSPDAARELLALGSVPPDVLAWREGLPGWVPLTDLLPPPAAPVAVRTVRARPDSFLRRLPGVFLYPFKKDGPIVLLAGTLFFWLLDLAQNFAGPLSLILALFSGGYLAAYVQGVIQSSAQGEDELPRWPEFSDWHQDILVPCLQMGVTVLLCLGPGWAVLGLAGADAGTPGLAWAGWALLGVGALYLPMALLAVAMADTLTGVSPTVVIPAMLRIRAPYGVTCGVLAAVFALNALLDFLLGNWLRIPVLSAGLQGFVGLYGLAVQARILGVLYHCHRDRLRWF